MSLSGSWGIPLSSRTSRTYPFWDSRCRLRGRRLPRQPRCPWNPSQWIRTTRGSKSSSTKRDPRISVWMGRRIWARTAGTWTSFVHPIRRRCEIRRRIFTRQRRRKIIDICDREKTFLSALLETITVPIRILFNFLRFLVVFLESLNCSGVVRSLVSKSRDVLCQNVNYSLLLGSLDTVKRLPLAAISFSDFYGESYHKCDNHIWQ